MRAKKRAEERAAQVSARGEEAVAASEEHFAHSDRIYAAAKMHGINIRRRTIHRLEGESQESHENRATEALNADAVASGLTDEHLAAYDNLIRERKAGPKYTVMSDIKNNVITEKQGKPQDVPRQPKNLWYPTDSKG
jgi:AICAR transformylase/IMP cyclohydrolase PurH